MKYLTARELADGETQEASYGSNCTELFFSSGVYQVRSINVADGRTLAWNASSNLKDARSEYRRQVRQIKTGGLY